MRYSIKNILKWTLYAALLVPALWKIAIDDFNSTSVVIGFAIATLLLPIMLIPNLIDYLLGNVKSADSRNDKSN